MQHLETKQTCLFQSNTCMTLVHFYCEFGTNSLDLDGEKQTHSKERKNRQYLTLRLKTKTEWQWNLYENNLPWGPVVWTSSVRRHRRSPGGFSSALSQPAGIFSGPEWQKSSEIELNLNLDLLLCRRRHKYNQRFHHISPFLLLFYANCSYSMLKKVISDNV